MSLTKSGDNLERFYVIMLPVRLNPPSTAALEAGTTKIRAATFERVG
jgi:hypothetical protein